MVDWETAILEAPAFPGYETLIFFLSQSQVEPKLTPYAVLILITPEFRFTIQYGLCLNREQLDVINKQKVNYETHPLVNMERL